MEQQLCRKLTPEQRDTLGTAGVEFEEHTDLSKQEVVDLYAASDLVVFVSTYEGFGLPILEAQATGRPVLTSSIPPMDEVAGAGALTVDPFDVDAIRAGLKRLLDEPDLRARLVTAGSENVRRYSAAAVAGQYAEVYRELAAGHAG